MPKTVVIKVDWNSIKSIEDAEKKKERLENKGYNLRNQTAGLFTSTMVYSLSK